MQVKLLRRFGQSQPGETVDVEKTTAEWLVATSWGTADGVQSVDQSAPFPGSHGADPVISGDVTRRRGGEFQKSGRDKDNRALPVDGSPVQYNAGIREEPPAGKERKQSARSEEPARSEERRPVEHEGQHRSEEPARDDDVDPTGQFRKPPASEE